MQTMLVGSGCKQLIEQGKNTSIRGLYYMLKHTIDGTKENTFEEQSECDPVIEDVEVLLGSLREELHLYADKRGEMVGNLTLEDNGDLIDCARMGSGGYGIPSIVEPNVINFKKCCSALYRIASKYWRINKCETIVIKKVSYGSDNLVSNPHYCILSFRSKP